MLAQYPSQYTLLWNEFETAGGDVASVTAAVKSITILSFGFKSLLNIVDNAWEPLVPINTADMFTFTTWKMLGAIFLKET